MALFGFGKKKEEKKSASCCCSGEGCASGCCDAKEASVLILGSGCKSCQTLEANTRAALAQMGDTETVIGHVTDFTEIAKYGVMRTPALVVEGQVVSSGRVLTVEEAAALLQKKES